MSTLRAVGLFGLVGLASLAGCIAPERYREVVAANDVLRDQIADLTRANQDYQKMVSQLEAEVQRMGPLIQDAAYLKQQKELIDSILKRYKDGTSTLPEGVVPVQVAEGLALRVEGRILFASGSDKLSPSGQATLKRLVEPVGGHTGKVRIAGHTDDDPIVHSSWKTNMRLSVGRALTVREYLVSQGLPEDKMSVAGYGEFDPVDKNDKAKNRRTEIVLLR